MCNVYTQYPSSVYIYKYIAYNTACVAQLAKASDSQAVGCVFEPRPYH